MRIVKLLPGRSCAFKFAYKPWIGDDLFEDDLSFNYHLKLKHDCVIEWNQANNEHNKYQIIAVPVAGMINRYDSTILYIIQYEDTSIYAQETEPKLGSTAVKVVIPKEYFDDIDDKEQYLCIRLLICAKGEVVLL